MVVLACYYLDGAPENVFRLRCYAFDDERRMALLRPPRAALAAAHAACADLPARGAAACAAALAATGRWEPLAAATSRGGPWTAASTAPWPTPVAASC